MSKYLHQEAAHVAYLKFFVASEQNFSVFVCFSSFERLWFLFHRLLFLQPMKHVFILTFQSKQEADDHKCH